MLPQLPWKSNLITDYSFNLVWSLIVLWRQHRVYNNLNILIFSWHELKIMTVFTARKRTSLSSLHCCFCVVVWCYKWAVLVLKTWLVADVMSLPKHEKKAKIYIFFTKENDNLTWIRNFNLIAGFEILTFYITLYWKKVVRYRHCLSTVGLQQVLHIYSRLSSEKLAESKWRFASTRAAKMVILTIFKCICAITLTVF